MKVAVFSRFPENVENPSGGVETATLGLLCGLRRRGGIQLEVVTLEKSRRQLKVEEKEGLRIHRLPASNWPMVADVMLGPGRALIQKYIASLKPDLVHFQESYGLGISELRGPTLFTIHGFDSLNLPTQQSRFWPIRCLMWRGVEKIGLGRQRFIISISPYVRKKIEKESRAEIFDIENAISEKFFRITRREIPGTILFAGWINPRKNLLGLIKAFAKLLEFGVSATLNVAGEAQPKYKEYVQEVRRTIGALGLEGKVRLLGRLNQAEVAKELSQASILVLPSRQENAPMVIAEALAAGVPVIASNLCGIPYMIQNGQNGHLVDPEDTEEMAGRIAKVMMDTDLRQKMSTAARRAARSRFHPDAVADKTIEVYRHVLKRHADGLRKACDR
jgi:glycosyltransferase involved in cell wall biosynthesis